MVRVSIGEVISARRSLVAGRLPCDLEVRLLEELERLLGEREQLAELVGRLRAPFADVRAVLREVDAVLRPGD